MFSWLSFLVCYWKVLKLELSSRQEIALFLLHHHLHHYSSAASHSMKLVAIRKRILTISTHLSYKICNLLFLLNSYSCLSYFRRNYEFSSPVVYSPALREVSHHTIFTLLESSGIEITHCYSSCVDFSTQDTGYDPHAPTYGG